MAEFGMASNHWVLPTIDRVEDGEVRAHVSIVVPQETDLTAEDVDLAVQAGGEQLPQTGRPDVLRLVTLVGTNAIGFFSFANPSNASPTAATVTLRGESVEFSFGDPGPLPVA